MRMQPTKQAILSATHVAAMPVASTAVVYSASFLFGSAEYFTLEYVGASPGTLGLKIELEVGSQAPTTEGSADLLNWNVPENAQDIESDLSNKTKVHFKKLAPPAALYGRLKITGSGSNDAGSTLTANLIRQEEL